MKELTLTQEYFICAVNEKGVLPSYRHEAVACLIASGILEMQFEKCVRIENKKVSICSKLPDNLLYLKPLYDVIDQPKPIKIEKLAEIYTITFTDRKLHELIDSIMIPLKKADVVVPVKSGLLGNKESYAPKRECINNIIEKIRAELLEKGTISEDVIALTSLLDKAGCLKEYFSKFEQKELSSRLVEIRTSQAGTIVKEMIDYIDSLLACMMISAII
ncbi:MAG: GPP34 family phosphoprotein [Coprococcus sp.]